MPNPQHLVDALTMHGWVEAGRRGGVYVRMARPAWRDRSLVVPFDTTAPEFDELWHAVIRELEDTVAVGVQAAHVLGDLWAPSSRVAGRVARLHEK